ncbi:alanine racemase [Neolewinella aurantiaca]|uniref:Alanine racemase n=1 Tax=Neolewinella aurantiaca TaxID=2602767 RepID=A0A5C7FU67_9BACT|nr:alanine racemase [Neolewinella aurantiaca]TXF88933.1 alanine racemase [Neolewinella aurantiaca]
MTEYTISALYTKYKDFDLVVDSRRLTRPERTLFFALPGERTDGHDFIPELFRSGVRHFVVMENFGARPQVQGELSEEQWAQASLLRVERPLALLQALAAHHRQQFDIPVLAITGSNGKTIVKDWLAQILSRRFNVCASPRSFNSQIGVPLSVWRLRREHQLAVFEAGVSESGEMARLEAIIKPTCGLFTMLGSAHDAGFPDRETKHREKLSLFKGAEWVAVSADDTDSVRLLRMADIHPLTYLGVEGRFLEVDEEAIRIDFPDLPRIYLENAYATAAVAYESGIDKSTLRSEIPKLRPLSNRLEQREGRRGGVVINDSYSNDLSALAAAIDFAVTQNPFEHLTLILGTLQPGSFNQPGTRGRAQMTELEQLLAGRVDRLITVGESYAATDGHLHYPTPEALLAALDELDTSPETILVKGASYERLDRIADALSRKQHQTLLRLDLTALRHNFQVYQRSVDAGMIVMVKASAYGGGSLPVARALAAAGAERLAVAYPDEGRTLREGGLLLPIMVLNAEAATFGRCATDKLEPVVHQARDLRRARAAGLSVHLEIDTGMARLGFQADDLDALINELQNEDYGPTIASVFTHLAAAEDQAHDGFTRGQIETFDAAYARIAAVLPAPPPRHVLNTNGISRFPDFAYEFVRLGIGLYGIGDASKADELRPALRLVTHITRIYDRPSGSSVGYGRRGKLSRQSRIAVLPVGYADGLPRLAGEGRFRVKTVSGTAPTVGSICMDMTTIDVTDLPAVRAGDEVTLFGPNHPIEILAAAAQTIPYEILTGIGPRVHRVYSEE